MSSRSFHHPQKVLLVQFSLYVHKSSANMGAWSSGNFGAWELWNLKYWVLQNLGTSELTHGCPNAILLYFQVLHINVRPLGFITTVIWCWHRYDQRRRRGCSLPCDDLGVAYTSWSGTWFFYDDPVLWDVCCSLHYIFHACTTGVACDCALYTWYVHVYSGQNIIPYLYCAHNVKIIANRLKSRYECH